MKKQLQKNAEKAGQHYLASLGYTRQIKAIRVAYQRVDFFGTDIEAKGVGQNKTVYCQITTGGYEAIRQRKRKLEKVPWDDLDVVMILVMKREKVGRKYVYWFERLDLDKTKLEWNLNAVPISIPREQWFSEYVSK